MILSLNTRALNDKAGVEFLNKEWAFMSGAFGGKPEVMIAVIDGRHTPVTPVPKHEIGGFYEDQGYFFFHNELFDFIQFCWSWVQTIHK